MKHIFLNLKRFDIPIEWGGVNTIASVSDWGSYIVKSTQEELKLYDPSEVEFIQYYPEAHILNAVAAKSANSPVQIGCQGVYRKDTGIHGFGAFTTNRPAAAMSALGVNAVLIGHCEERNDKMDILAQAGIKDSVTVNRILNQEIKMAVSRGMKILYCIGEQDGEQEHWEEVLGVQLKIGLADVDLSNVVIGYEPVWSIGPGKAPADKPYIKKIAQYIKQVTGGADVVYGGGLKVDNAEMLSSIEEIDGGLIALTRFSGGIGFYPDEYLQIIKTYLGK